MNVSARVYWKPRQESLDACASKLRKHFSFLEELSASTKTWHAPGHSRKHSNSVVEAHEEGALKALLEAGLNRRDVDRSPIEELGWHIGLWNGRSGEWACSTSVLCGGYARSVTNHARLEINNGTLDGLSVEPKAIMERLADIWDADRGVLDMDGNTLHRFKANPLRAVTRLFG